MLWKKTKKQVPNLKEPIHIEVEAGNLGTLRSSRNDPTYEGVKINVRRVTRVQIPVSDVKATS